MKTARPEPSRHVLIRVLEMGSLNEAVGIIAPETLRRDVTFTTRRPAGPGEETMPGLVIIGGDDLEPMARTTGRIVLKIMSTDELLWLPVNAHREFGAWTIEAVPLTDWMRLTTIPDATILRTSNIDPTTGYPVGQQPPR